MKTTTHIMHASRKGLLLGGMTAAFLLVSLLGIKSAQAMITSTLDIGSNGSQVTELQTYLAGNASFYPSGLITGYYGALTAAGVQRFQAAHSIVSSGTAESTGYGRVGPQTMSLLNSLMGNSTPGVSFDSAPVLSKPSIQLNGTSATFTWTTNEASQGQVYYDTAPLRADEATGPRQLPFVSGAYSNGSTGQTSHSITVLNLLPATTYYFLTRAIDTNGNMSMTWPSTFRTN